MPEQQRSRARVWWLSGILAGMGACIAVFASQEYFGLTMMTLSAAVIVTVLLGIELAQRDRT